MSLHPWKDVFVSSVVSYYKHFSFVFSVSSADCLTGVIFYAYMYLKLYYASYCALDIGNQLNRLTNSNQIARYKSYFKKKKKLKVYRVMGVLPVS